MIFVVAPRDLVVGAKSTIEAEIMRELLSLASRLAHQAGELTQAIWQQARGEVTTKTTPTDVVTAADRAAERLIVDAIIQARPEDGVLGEEGGHRESRSGLRWVIDPIDGTVNYLYGHPHYAISIAVERYGEPVVGVVRNPATGEQWHAVTGEGAWRDGRRLKCASPTGLGKALIATGFGYDARRRAHQGTVVAELLPQVRDIRRAGTCALDLCFVAEGRLDGYYEQGCQRWDAAAGSLIVSEAGGRVTGLRGEPFGPRMILAAGGAVYSQLHDALVTAGADYDPLAATVTRE
ncbi:MAG: inositol monophosphatase family protein [Mycobacteriales bacterium]